MTSSADFTRLKSSGVVPAASSIFLHIAFEREPNYSEVSSLVVAHRQLALIAHLGWSPVIRGIMRKKRDDVDEIEDGGRAKVVEELVLKAIHSEGERQAKEAGRCSIGGPVRIFPDRSTITFRLLKTLRVYVEGLEVWENAYWEWEDAICDGCEVFFQLRKHQQGTVHVDLEKRKLTFSPTVAPDVLGVTVSLGMGAAAVDENETEDVLSPPERE